MKDHFYGYEVSAYAKANGYVDYGTFAKTFDHVLNNDIRRIMEERGWEFDLVNGNENYYLDSEGNEYTPDERDEKVEELEELLESETADVDREKIEADLEALEMEHWFEGDIYQEFIISEWGYEIISRYTNDFVWYCESLDMYIWGVCHWGTAWSHVLTNIKLDD